MSLLLLLLCLFFVCTSRADNDAYLTLDIERGSMTSPQHYLTTTITIGRPERRYKMLVDFSAHELDMRTCMSDASYTFESGRTSSDIVMLSDDALLDPVKRGIYRMRMRDHCDPLAAPFNSTTCAAVVGCEGVLGVGARSPLWVKWSGVTITKQALHIGARHPYRLPPKTERIACSGARTERLCEFEALFAGRRVRVDFHSHDSYIYVPADLHLSLIHI